MQQLNAAAHSHREVREDKVPRSASRSSLTRSRGSSSTTEGRFIAQDELLSPRLLVSSHALKERFTTAALFCFTSGDVQPCSFQLNLPRVRD